MGFSNILVAALLTGAAPAPEACKSIPGWENIVSDKKIRWIVLGEMHGTNEMPEIFADAICLTSEGKPVNVALEMPTIDQSRIDAYLTSDGGTEAKRSFLQANIWNGRFKDGRSSEAMFRLFDRLRHLHKIGRIRAVVAFQPVRFKEPPSATEYERSMADIIKDNTPKGVRTLILVGNVHAMKTKVNFGPEPYFAMAGHLPKGKTLSLDIVNDGGLAWACGGPGQCGPMAIGRKNSLYKRSVTVAVKPDAAYDGQLFLGSETTASPPQSGIPPVDEKH